MKFLLDRKDHEVQIARVLVAQIVESFNEEVITLLLNRRGDDVKITEEVVKAAGNRRSGKEVVTLQLNLQCRSESCYTIQISCSCKPKALHILYPLPSSKPLMKQSPVIRL